MMINKKNHLNIFFLMNHGVEVVDFYLHYLRPKEPFDIILFKFNTPKGIYWLSPLEYLPDPVLEGDVHHYLTWLANINFFNPKDHWKNAADIYVSDVLANIKLHYEEYFFWFASKGRKMAESLKNWLGDKQFHPPP